MGQWSSSMVSVLSASFRANTTSTVRERRAASSLPLTNGELHAEWQTQTQSPCTLTMSELAWKHQSTKWLRPNVQNLKSISRQECLNVRILGSLSVHPRVISKSQIQSFTILTRRDNLMKRRETLLELSRPVSIKMKRSLKLNKEKFARSFSQTPRTLILHWGPLHLQEPKHTSKWQTMSLIR